MSGFSIRDALPQDAALLLRFVKELAEYEKAGLEVVATEESLRLSLFCNPPVARALVCSEGTQAVGFALYFYNYSTWLASKGLFLEDLYVSPEHRGKGAGMALFQHLARIAKEEECARFEWNVLDWNTPAIGFYEALGAKAQSEWVGYRLEGAGILELAKGLKDQG